MWPFTKKQTLEKCKLLTGFTDYHSHVLPGVDDGIKKYEDSMRVIKEYERQGVSTLWLTPHIMEDMPNRTSDLRRRFEALKEKYDGPVVLKLASENMLDNLFETRISANDVLPIGDKGNHLLVETSYFEAPSDFEGKLGRVCKAGYFPLLAHPERYMYMDTEEYDNLYDRGIKMQLNLSSLFGFYGKEAKRKAEYMLLNEYYHAVGSDTHRVSQVTKSLAEGYLTKKMIEMLRRIPGIE